MERFATGIGYVAGGAGQTVHVDINTDSPFSGTGANGTSGTWNLAGTAAANLLYSDGTVSSISYVAENWSGGPFATSWTTHPLLRDFLYERDPNPIDATLKLTGLDDDTRYDVYIYAGAEGGIYRVGDQTSIVTFQGIGAGGDVGYADDAPLEVPNNTGLLTNLSPSGGEIVIEFETNPGTATATILGDSVVDLAGFTIVEKSVDPLIATDIGGPMFGANATAYVRVPFTVADPTAFDVLRLNIQYDDGFVAYLNGVEAARGNAPGSEGTTLPFNATATQENPIERALKIESFDISSHLGALRLGDNILAIHGLNLQPGDEDFLLLPTLQGLRFPLEVTATDPPDGANVTPSPTEFVLAFSRELDPATVQAEDLRIDGEIAVVWKFYHQSAGDIDPHRVCRGQ